VRPYPTLWGALPAADWSALAAIHQAIQAQLTGAGGRLQPAMHPQLGQDIGHVHAARLTADKQGLGDLAVRASGDQQVQHL
jgi:hypothetical protein